MSKDSRTQDRFGRPSRRQTERRARSSEPSRTTVHSLGGHETTIGRMLVVPLSPGRRERRSA